MAKKDEYRDHLAIVEEDEQGKEVFRKPNQKEKEGMKRSTILSKVNMIKLDNYLENVEMFHEIQPFFYDKSKMFWFWNLTDFKYEPYDEVDVMLALESQLNFYGQTIKSNVKTQYIEAFKRVGRKNIPKEPNPDWIQFKEKIYNIKTTKYTEASPDYFFTNPIPWEVGDTDKTPTINKLFIEWVGEKYVDDLYEIVAYCCYRSYPIQNIFCLLGSGRNGKSQFMKMLIKFLGVGNTCSTELDALANPQSRFESFKLYKKLMCSMGETDCGTLQSTSMLKKLTGGDLIGYEVKGKNPFDDYNYAKIIIGSNSLPSSNDTSEGFMRRWNIIDFPNEFKEGKDIIEGVPEVEYQNLAKRILHVLRGLLERGMFTNQGTIDQRREKYIMSSNPLPIFIKECCKVGNEEHIIYSKLYTEYIGYLRKHKKRKVNRKEFKSALEDEGFYMEKTTFKGEDGEFKNGYYIIGISFSFYDNYDIMTTISTDSSYSKINLETHHNCHNCHKKEEKIGLTHYVCNVCGLYPCSAFASTGKPLCYGCAKTKEINGEKVNWDV